MLRRFLLRSLVLAGIILACFGQLVWRGAHARKVVLENFPTPHWSTGKVLLAHIRPTGQPGHVYDLTFVPEAEGGVRPPQGARLMIQLATAQTRILVVRGGHPNTSVSWWEVLRGRESLQILPDRGWLDLGEMPADGAPLEVQVVGLLPAPYGFYEIFTDDRPAIAKVRIARPDSPRARPLRILPRYRFLVPAPVPPGETLARFFFFISCSRVLQATGFAALVLLFAGWWWLWEKRAARAVACLVPALTLLHACCLAPLQGADEATHVGTVEAVLFNPDLFKNPSAYPKSIARLYEAIGYFSWAGYPDIPVTGLLPENRDATRDSVSKVLASEAREDAGVRPDAFLINPRTRAPLYYNSFRLVGSVLKRLSVLDRVEAYVVLSTLMSLGFFLAGLWVLARAGLDTSIVAIYGLVSLWPYSVGVVASCSNYSLAIGIGQFLTACLVAGVLAGRQSTRLLAAAAFSFVSLVGIGVWDDFVFFALPSLIALTLLAAAAAWRLPASGTRRLATGSVLSIGVPLTIALTYALATGRIRRLISSLGARLPKELGGFEDPSLWLLLAMAAAPLVVCLILVLAIVRSSEWAAATRQRAARIRSAALIALFVGMFIATPWTTIPFETTRLDYPDEVAAHWASFWSNNFAFDQDVLSWKMYWGVFGYADVSYPDVFYAIARWGCVGLFLALPILSWRFTQRSPARSAFLLAASGFALSVCIVTNSLRYFVPTNPWGRFILPALPLVALPSLARAGEAVSRAGPTRLALAVLAALHVWTAIALVGSRYSVGL